MRPGDGASKRLAEKQDFYSPLYYVVYRFVLILPFSVVDQEVQIFFVFKVID